MNNVDKQYLDILKRILDEGSLKHTRAGDTLSIFGVHAEFNLKEGLPLLTTKKVFYKGIIHELIWFLKGDTNIKYLIDNNVNIWTDDAYRWYKSLNFKEYGIEDTTCIEGISKLDKMIFDLIELEEDYQLWDDVNDKSMGVISKEELKSLPKERFVTWVKESYSLNRILLYKDRIVREDKHIYKFGDLGPIYGKQWRSFGVTNRDQIKNIIETLKTNPDDRRMLCISYNPDVLDKIALPACHTMFQFYTRELTHQERFTWLQEHGDNKYDEWKTVTEEILNELNVPKRALSLSFAMRSNDFCCGNPYNISQYALLVYIMCHLCNMIPEKLIYNGGDVHVYCNHIENAKIQLQRQGSDKLPTVKINSNLHNINDIKFEDILIEGYEPDTPIKYQLNVG